VNIQTARLRIRDLTPADAEGLFPIYADAEVRRFIGGEPTQTLDGHLGRFAWGNGYATEAAGAMLDHARDTLKLSIVYAIILPENVRSIRVTERLGMKPLGLTTRYYGHEALHFAAE
jgi:RimJ/RimL family protein N-acetyltransferase